MKMLSDYLEGESAISELARDYGISRKTAYKWIERYETGGPAALVDQSRAPRHHPNAVAAQVERALLELKGQRPLWGAPKLRRKLELALGAERCPAESTVSEILRRHGLTQSRRRRWRAVPSSQPFAACQTANAVWCADFKGWFRTGDGAKCTPLTISDGHSRYLLRCQGLGDGLCLGATALCGHVPRVRAAAGDAHRQRIALCRAWTRRLERTGRLVGAPGH
jgi:transposase-like protein